MRNHPLLRTTIGTLLFGLFVVVLVTSGRTAGQFTVAHAAQPLASERTITMSGYGEVSVPPDLALVKLQVGNQMGYPPVVPGTPLFTEEDLTVLGDALRAGGIATSDIITQPFSSLMGYSSSFLGELRFVTTAPKAVEKLLRQLYKTVEENRGPQFQVTGLAFTIKDCDAWEEKALEVALATAKARATRAAAKIGATVGEIITMKESSLYYGPGPFTNCLAIEQAQTGRDPSAISGAGTPTEVRVSAALEITFALEPSKQ